MINRVKALAIFVAVCALIGLGASLGAKAHALDLVWIGLVWAMLIYVTVATVPKAWRQWNKPGGLEHLGESRGVWLLPRRMTRWLFDLSHSNGGASRH